MQKILSRSTSCSKWNLGLNDIKLDNNKEKYSCEFIIPKKCYMNAFNGIFDLSKILRNNCKKDNQYIQKNKLLKYLDNKFNNITKIGFPITTSKDFWLRTQKNI